MGKQKSRSLSFQAPLVRLTSTPSGKTTTMVPITGKAKKEAEEQARRDREANARIAQQVEAANRAVLEGTNPNRAIQDERHRQHQEPLNGETSLKIEPIQEESDVPDPRIVEQMEAAERAGGKWIDPLNRGIEKNQAIIKERHRQRQEQM